MRVIIDVEIVVEEFTRGVVVDGAPGVVGLLEKPLDKLGDDRAALIFFKRRGGQRQGQRQGDGEKTAKERGVHWLRAGDAPTITRVSSARQGLPMAWRRAPSSGAGR